MKILKFTVRRGDIDSLIHSLKALQKLHDKPSQTARFVACNLLEMPGKDRFLGIMRDKSVRIVIQIDRALGKQGQLPSGEKYPLETERTKR